MRHGCWVELVFDTRRYSFLPDTLGEVTLVCSLKLNVVANSGSYEALVRLTLDLDREPVRGGGGELRKGLYAVLGPDEIGVTHGVLNTEPEVG